MVLEPDRPAVGEPIKRQTPRVALEIQRITHHAQRIQDAGAFDRRVVNGFDQLDFEPDQPFVVAQDREPGRTRI